MNQPFDASSFSHNLRIMREVRQLTQRELGLKAGLAESWISNFENGVRHPSLRNFVKLCVALDCSPDDLLMP